MARRIRNDFLAGLVVLLPLVITVWVLGIFWRFMNASMLEPVIRIFGRYLVNRYLVFGIKVALFIIILFVIYLIGVGTRIIFIRRFFAMWERLFYGVPMVGKIYSTVKEIRDAFIGKGKGIFQAAVLVEYPRNGIYSIGFLVNEDNDELDRKTGKKLLSVFVATVPNPTSGFLIHVPEEDVIRLDISIEDAMKLVISGGILRPPSKGHSEAGPQGAK